MFKKLLSAGTLLTLGILTISCGHSPTRGPASTVSVAANQRPLTMLIDYFASSNDKYRFTIDRNFSTDKDKKYLSEKAQKSLHEAFAKTFYELGQGDSVKDTSASIGVLLGKLKGNITAPLISNFAKTLEVYKILDTDIKYDLLFVPELITDSFETEFGSNELSPLWTRGRLQGKLAALNEDQQVVSVKKLARSLKPSADPQFLGGAISFKAKLAKTNLFRSGSFLFSGTITYRRYFLEAEKHGNFTFKQAGRPGPISTVDVVYSIDKSAMKPVLKKITVYPGHIVGTNPLGSELQVEQTASLRHGDVEIKRLVYNVADDKVDFNNSSLKLHEFYPTSEDINAEDRMVQSYLKKNTERIKIWLVSYGTDGGTL